MKKIKNRVTTLALIIIFSVITPFTASAKSFWDDGYVIGSLHDKDAIKENANKYVESRIKDFIDSYLANYPIFHDAGRKLIKADDYINADIKIYDSDSRKTIFDAQKVNFQLGKDVLDKSVEDVLVKTNAGIKQKIYASGSGCLEKYGFEEVTFEIKVNDVLSPEFKTEETITDEYAKRLGFESAQNLYETLRNEALENIDTYKKEAVYENIKEMYDVNLPAELIDCEVKQQEEIMLNQNFLGDTMSFNNYIVKAYKTKLNLNNTIKDVVNADEEKNLVLYKAGQDLKIGKNQKYEDCIEEMALSQGYVSKSDLYDAYDTTLESGEDYLAKYYIIDSVVENLCPYTKEDFKHSGTYVATCTTGGATTYFLPQTRGFKCVESYTAITNQSSKQYALQQIAKTSHNGIRTVNDRYCVAMGTFFGMEIGQYFDLKLQNGTVIKCILGDIKSDIDTDENNITTKYNGCASEFISDVNTIPADVYMAGDVSKLYSDWDSPVKEVTVYGEKVIL